MWNPPGAERNPPFPGQTYPAATVIGMPSAVKRLRTATRIWTSATWRSNCRDISRWPSSFTQFIFVSTLLRRWYLKAHRTASSLCVKKGGAHARSGGQKAA